MAYELDLTNAGPVSGPNAYAIRPGARGDIAGSADWIAWMGEESPYLSTPVISGKQIYAFGARVAFLKTLTIVR